MPELTPEDKQRIYEEEKARLEAQEQAKADLEKQKTKRKTRDTAIGCLVLLVIAVAIGLWLSGGGSDLPEHSKEGAFYMSQAFVKDRLVSPTTAKFPSYADKFVSDLGDGRYRVSAYVDAQNAFGATIRSNYSCTLLYVGDGKWRLEDITID